MRRIEQAAAKAAATTIIDMRTRLANDTARAAAAEFLHSYF